MPVLDVRPLAPGLQTARIVTGLWQVADLERGGKIVDPIQASDAIARYVERGLHTFDMADHYGSAEDVWGTFRQRHAALASKAQAFTKWVPSPGPITMETTRAAVERAQRRMHTKRIDLMQFHAWSFAHPSWLDALWSLSELQGEGMIGALGVTNFDAAHLRVAWASGIPISTNQVSFSLLDRRAAFRLRDVCEEKGVRLLAYGTLLGGFLSDRWLGKDDPRGTLQTWSQMKYYRFIETAGGWEALQRLLRAARAVADRYEGATIAAVATRFILDDPSVAAIIVGARLGETEHIDSTLGALHLRLSSEDVSTLDEAIATLKPIPGDCGDEYRRPPYLTASGDLSHHIDTLPPPFPVARDERGRERAFSGTTWEGLAGFSRAVKDGNRILVSGTTATHGSRAIGVGDPVAQAHFVIDKIEASLASLGASLRDVIRTRIYVRNVADWEPIARVHGERFASVLPANTLVRADLIGEEYLVEMEAEAVVTS